MQDFEGFHDIMEEKTISLVPGDRYLIYTDGLIEATDLEKNAYGFGRLNRLLQNDADSGPEQLINKIIDDIRSFTGDAPDYDDLTLCAFKVY
jgi:sigma-B regulation protein RsbU (phosphoserine phosphatase)